MPGRCSNRLLRERWHDPLIQLWIALLFSHAPAALQPERKITMNLICMEQAMYRNVSVTHLLQYLQQKSNKMHLSRDWHLSIPIGFDLGVITRMRSWGHRKHSTTEAAAGYIEQQ
jgi:hypothetical protein